MTDDEIDKNEDRFAHPSAEELVSKHKVGYDDDDGDTKRRKLDEIEKGNA